MMRDDGGGAGKGTYGNRAGVSTYLEPKAPAIHSVRVGSEEFVGLVRRPLKEMDRRVTRPAAHHAALPAAQRSDMDSPFLGPGLGHEGRLGGIRSGRRSQRCDMPTSFALMRGRPGPRFSLQSPSRAYSSGQYGRGRDYLLGEALR